MAVQENQTASRQVVLQEELSRALGNSARVPRWVMVIDLKKCIGCGACVIACKSENKTPPGVSYMVLMDKESGKFPAVERVFTPRPCMQCERPPCAKVCPVAAIHQRQDGVVTIDYEKCIGCRFCILACPYGAIGFDFGSTYTAKTPERQNYELVPNFEYGKRWRKDPKDLPAGSARKCMFCLHRVKKGMLPACVSACPAGALYFGDLNDPESTVSRLLGERKNHRLKEKLGTNPNVYYLE